MNSTTGIILALLAAFILYRQYRKRQNGKKVAEALVKGAQIIDVRTPAEFKYYPLPQAKNIPLDRLPKKLSSMDKEQTYITCCASGVRSARASMLLRQSGFGKVINGGGQSDIRKHLETREG